MIIYPVNYLFNSLFKVGNKHLVYKYTSPNRLTLNIFGKINSDNNINMGNCLEVLFKSDPPKITDITQEVFETWVLNKSGGIKSKKKPRVHIFLGDLRHR